MLISSRPLSRGTRHSQLIRFRSLAEAIARSPRAPTLIVFDAPRPDDATREALARASEAWSGATKLVVGNGSNLSTRAAAWAGIVDGTISRPISPANLASWLVLSSARLRAETAARKHARRVQAMEDRLALMADTIQAAGSLLDPSMVARFIMERAAGLVGSLHWRLYRVDESAGLLRLDAKSIDPEMGARLPDAIPLESGLAGWVARQRQVVVVDPVAGDPRVDRDAEWPGTLPQSILAMPLVSRGRVIGVIELADPSRDVLSWRRQGLLHALCSPSAIALDNALLFRRLEERTVTDDLTHLYNARFMENYLRRETKRADRFHRPVALLFIDLDGFKQVNDSHGHMAGSRTLVEVGEILRKNVREVDIVSRWGGDEFAVVLPETGLDGAIAMAERIRRRICEGPYLEGTGIEIAISASIGVAVWPEHGRTAEALLAAADSAMYRVKDRGKNGVLAATEVGEELLQPS
jgi:diguanylate cyclase (GGDEF)-like protein